MLTKLEQQLREELRELMKGMWRLTWHEDREINPGVPDISFVMLQGNCETGWLELKAKEEFNKSGKVKFGIEPSQFQWVERHAYLVPVHLLVAVADDWWIIRGKDLQLLASSVSERDLDSLGIPLRGTLGAPGRRAELASRLIQLTTRRAI